LLKELQRDGRISLAELARRLHISAPTVAERLQRLELAGVIRGYHADLDPTAVGYALSVIVRVRPASRQLHKVAELVHKLPEIVEAHPRPDHDLDHPVLARPRALGVAGRRIGRDASPAWQPEPGRRRPSR
jgi:DNA-binding Lrp family transcriptional regulator